MGPSRGLLLDIGGVVVVTGIHLVGKFAEREPAVRAVVDEIGGIATEQDELWQQMLRREVTERDYWAERARQLGAALGQRWDTRAMISRLYDLPQDEWLQAGTVALMRDAKQAGLPLGALTNDLGLFHGPDWAGLQDFLRLFDVIVDASVTGILKPDPQAYLSAASQLGLAPEQIVFLDDMPWNTAGAAAVGMVAVRVAADDPGAAIEVARQRLGLPARVG